jgi:hypothetical protein
MQAPANSVVDLTIIYKLADRNPTGAAERRVYLDTWSCPLCDIHGPFSTREMLAVHLGWMHEDVNIRKSVPKVNVNLCHMTHDAGSSLMTIASRTNGNLRYCCSRIREALEVIKLENVTMSMRMSVGRSPNRSLITQRSDRTQGPQVEIDTTKSSANAITVIRPMRAATTSESISPATATNLNDEVLEPPAKEVQQPMPKFKLEFAESVVRAAPTSRSREFIDAVDSKPRHPSPIPTLPRPDSLPRYLPDPPSADPLGPAAQFPYLPFPPTQFYDDDEELRKRYVRVEFSTRPQGPKLYDLITALPLDRFGPLTWQVVDKEEELFEPDDVRDEGKVMMALWARWILINR